MTPQALEISTTDPTEVFQASGSALRTTNIFGLLLSLHSSAPGEVYLAFGTKKNLTADTGMTLYPGQGIILASDDPRMRGILNGGLFAIAESASTELRYQLLS